MAKNNQKNPQKQESEFATKSEPAEDVENLVPRGKRGEKLLRLPGLLDGVPVVQVVVADGVRGVPVG